MLLQWKNWKTKILALGLILPWAGSHAYGNVKSPLCDARRELARCNEEVKAGETIYTVIDLVGREYVYEELGNDQRRSILVAHKVEQCLIEMLACNKTQTVATVLNNAMQISSGDSLPTALPPNQEFLLANALYRLHIETRSEALRCAYRSRAKAQLIDFLSQSKQHTDQGGNLLTLNIANIQGAINMMKQLDQPNNCPEATLTLGEIVTIVRDYTATEIVNVFTAKTEDATSTDSTENPVTKSLQTIFDMVQGFMDIVAEVETAVQLLDVEILANNNKLVSIANGPLKSLYCPGVTGNCDKITVTAPANQLASITLDSLQTPELLNAAVRRNQRISVGVVEINKVEKAISRLVAVAYACHVQRLPGSCEGTEAASGEATKAYESLRTRLTSDTYYWAEQATRQDYYLRELLAGTSSVPKTSVTSYKDIVEGFRARPPLDSPMDAARALQKTFENKFGASLCVEYKLWYCCTAFPNYPYCKN